MDADIPALDAQHSEELSADWDPHAYLQDERGRAKKAESFWYPHQPARWLVRTELLSLEAHGAYDRLRNRQFIEGPIRNDPKVIARYLRITVDQWEEIFDELRELLTADGDSLSCPDIEQTRKETADKRARRAAAGSLGGRATWQSRRPGSTSSS